MTQNERVLARLRQGPVAAVEFQPPDVCDGGPPIWRVAARIDVLKSRGHVIASERRSDGTAVYRLVSGSERALSDTQNPALAEQADPGFVPSTEGVRSAAPAQSHSLFDASVFTEHGGYRDAEAA